MCCVKTGVLRNFAKFTGNTCARVSFLIKLQPREISKNAFPYRTPPGDCFQSLKRIKNVG